MPINLTWAQVRIELQSENGLLGIGPYPPESEVDSVFILEVLVVGFLFGGFHSLGVKRTDLILYFFGCLWDG